MSTIDPLPWKLTVRCVDTGRIVHTRIFDDLDEARQYASAMYQDKSRCIVELGMFIPTDSEIPDDDEFVPTDSEIPDDDE